MNIPHTMFSVQSRQGGAAIMLPNPDMDSAKATIATMVNSGRNASAVVTAQKIGRDQDKTELSWTLLDKEEWENLLAFFDENFYFIFTYYSPVAQRKISRVFYASDRTYQPFQVDANGVPTAYKACSLSVVDTGEGA